MTSSCPAQVPPGPAPPEHRDDPLQPGLVGGAGRSGLPGSGRQHPSPGQGRALHGLLVRRLHPLPPPLPQRGPVHKSAL